VLCFSAIVVLRSSAAIVVLQWWVSVFSSFICFRVLQEQALNGQTAGRPGTWEVHLEGSEDSESLPSRFQRLLVESAGSDAIADGASVEWGPDGCTLRCILLSQMLLSHILPSHTLLSRILPSHMLLSHMLLSHMLLSYIGSIGRLAPLDAS